MIVEQRGYLKYVDVENLFLDDIDFSIYTTHKGTQILIESDRCEDYISYINYPDYSRMRWKLDDGKEVSAHSLQRIFNSKTDCISTLDLTGWNNGNQIMTYYEYVPTY